MCRRGGFGRRPKRKKILLPVICPCILLLMGMNTHIKSILDRKARLLAAKPAVGQNTVTTKIRLQEGLTFGIEEGNWNLTADLSPKSGGKDLGPTPGTYGRAALGSCLAISYMMWAARLEVPIDSLEVEIQVDYDARGMYGVSDEVTPGYLEVRYTVFVESPAPEAEILNLLDTSDRCCSYLDVFARPQSINRTVLINSLQPNNHGS